MAKPSGTLCRISAKTTKYADFLSARSAIVFSAAEWRYGTASRAVHIRAALTIIVVRAPRVPVIAIDSGTNSKTEMRIMMPAEKPSPVAIAWVFSRNEIASATPRQVVTEESRESRIIAP